MVVSVEERLPIGLAGAVVALKGAMEGYAQRGRRIKLNLLALLKHQAVLPRALGIDAKPREADLHAPLPCAADEIHVRVAIFLAPEALVALGNSDVLFDLVLGHDPTARSQHISLRHLQQRRRE